MTCHYCRSENAQDDHRCRRCGRRLMGTAVEASPEYSKRALQAVGANALAAATAEMELAKHNQVAGPKSSEGQSSLFLEEAAPKVVPIQRSQKRPATEQGAALPDTSELYPSRSAKPQSRTRKHDVEHLQEKLDFCRPLPKPLAC